MRERSVRGWLQAAVSLTVCLGLLAGLLPLAATSAPGAASEPAASPHPPDPRRSAAPAPERTLIVLSLILPAETPPAVWQQLWTVVQWQDAAGGWHDVTGWRGALDEAAFGVGKKTWVVEDKDPGTGLFVWRVYAYPGGELVAASPPFYLPAKAGDIFESRVIVL